VNAHLRRIGRLQPRNLPRLPTWLGEQYLAFGLSALTVYAPYTLPGIRLGRLRIVRRAAYFDGHAAGRFEVLLSTDLDLERAPVAFRAAEEVVRIRTEVQVPCEEALRAQPLVRAGPALARVWAAATTPHGSDPHAGDIVVHSPVVFMEADTVMMGLDGSLNVRPSTFELDAGEDRRETTFGLKLGPIGRTGSRGVVIGKHSVQSRPPVPHADQRGASRVLRAYLARLSTDTMALNRILGDARIDLASDPVQAALNAYTRHIGKVRRRLGSDALSRLAYEAYDNAHPGGRTEMLHRLADAAIRPNLLRKVESCLDAAPSAYGNVLTECRATDVPDLTQTVVYVFGSGHHIGQIGNNTITNESGTIEIVPSVSRIETTPAVDAGPDSSSNSG
jgi:hypothetical protein